MSNDQPGTDQSPYAYNGKYCHNTQIPSADDLWFCPACGSTNRAGSFCTECGAARPGGPGSAPSQGASGDFPGQAPTNTYVPPIDYHMNQDPTPSDVPGNGFAIASLVMGLIALLGFVFGGFICGILGIVFGVIARKKGNRSKKVVVGFVLSILGIVFSALVWSYAIIADPVPYETSSGYSITQKQQVSASAQDVGKTRLDLYAKSDAATVAQLQKDFEGTFRYLYEVSPSDLGIISADVAKWMLAGFAYTQTDVYATDGDSWGYIDYDVSCHDMYSVYDDFNAWIDETPTSDFASSDEYLAAAGAKFCDLLDTRHSTESVTIFLDGDSSGWTIDEEWWEDEYRYIFCLSDDETGLLSDPDVIENAA